MMWQILASPYCHNKINFCAKYEQSHLLQTKGIAIRALGNTRILTFVLSKPLRALVTRVMSK